MPRSQFQNLGLPVDASFSSMVTGAQPLVMLEVKSATGAWLFTINPANNKPVKNINRINSISLRSQNICCVWHSRFRLGECSTGSSNIKLHCSFIIKALCCLNYDTCLNIQEFWCCIVGLNCNDYCSSQIVTQTWINRLSFQGRNNRLFKATFCFICKD